MLLGAPIPSLSQTQQNFSKVKMHRPNWYTVNKLNAANGQENLYRLTMSDVSVVNINARVQGIVLAHAQEGVEFQTRKVWRKFCKRVLSGQVNTATLKTVRGNMSTWPEDVQRIWKFIMTAFSKRKKYFLKQLTQV